MPAESMATMLGACDAAVRKALAEAEESKVLQRIWQQDASVWKSEESHQKIIRNSLGWLTVPGKMMAAVGEIQSFVDQIRRDRSFKHVMLCGMGGSSLCPEVLRQTFGNLPGYPELLVLDSTDPDVLAGFASRINLKHCLFVIASKSGTTTEPLVFYKYWYDQVGKVKTNPGDSFVAITDPGTRMVEMATADQFRHIFLNPPDIGGRYSALSYFGLVPAALLGLDIKLLLERAAAMMKACGPEVTGEANPALMLGAIMGECAKAGRNKLTLVTDPELSALGLWIEQLVAESTGKEGQGIVPVNNEPLGAPAEYGDDRIFVVTKLEYSHPATENGLELIKQTGQPAISRQLTNRYDLAGEFFLWELATAVAGWRLGINPFDQPNVQESKDATKELLDSYKAQGKLDDQELIVADGALSVYASDRTSASLPRTSVAAALQSHLRSAGPGDYIAFLCYVEETPEIEATLQGIRVQLRKATKCATTTGYGPRFLHSTGQLHKGGSDEGVFIQLTAGDKVDLPIPNEPYTFSILKQAQALGDFRSLSAHNRRAIRVDLGADALTGLRQLQKTITEALGTSAESNHG